MATKVTFKSTARSGKTETLEQVLERIQRMRVPDGYFLMGEHWDWLVVMQCLQDNKLFTSHSRRMPLKEFSQWIASLPIRYYLTQCSLRNLTYVNHQIGGARYPWTDVAWEPQVLKRWRVLYETLDAFLKQEVMS